MAAHLIDPPSTGLNLHPRFPPFASPRVARLALLNHVAERAVLFAPMSPEKLLTRVFAPPHPRLVLATDPARQRAYLQLFLGPSQSATGTLRTRSRRGSSWRV